MDAHRAALRRTAAAAVPALFAAVFFVLPLAAIVRRGLVDSGGLSFPSDVLLSPETALLLWFTTWQAAASTAVTLAFGLPLAWVVGRFSFRGRGLVRALVLVPFVLPTVVVATAFLALLPAGLEHGIWAILAAHATFNIAVVTRIVGGAWAGLDRTEWDVAATLGAGPLRRLREVTLPLLAPAVSASAALTFLFCFTSFGVVLILGGPGRATLETEIYNQAARAFDLRAAAALSLLQLAAVAAVLVVASRLESRVAGVGAAAAGADALRRPAGRERIAVAAVLGGAAVALGLPFAVLVQRSLGGYEGLLRETPALLVTPWHAAVNSVLFAAAAAAIAVAAGTLAAAALADARPGAADALVLLPLGASAVMLGFGFLIAFDSPPLDFRSQWWLVPVAQSLVAMPFVIRIVTPALRAIDPRLREAAAVLGATPARARREIDLPLAARAIATAAGFAFAIALGEFGATVFLARADRPTLPVAIFRFLGRPGAENQQLAAALAVLLAAVAVAAALAAERAAAGRRGAI
ncbi:ABC-type Fe3+ transport system permease component [Gaiella occulta]|uniref:ABC-type Fe3+ transport system permease component n=1 Tax=Gaiella occulta TaxID=1002870 RepID=A0A7M2Z1P2_9ACTN|nr:iron ABC transporter permease [Gaiella occulta]RDI76039.1 ABC-type Fe3+ transport system permease component [Gaiella occulta]